MIEAMVISVQEPQLERSLKAVMNQSIPFNRVTHVDSVIPESEAVNRGFSMIQSDWVMKVDGDTILYSNAVETARKYLKENKDNRICAFYFGLHDTFLDCDIGFCGVLRTAVYQSIKRKDKLLSDLTVNMELRKQGWIIRKLIKEVIGTHFDKPDEFQVFHRFYCAGKRADNNQYAIQQLTKMMEQTHDPLYHLALRAIQFAKFKNRYYIGSHNLDFDRKLYEEFKTWE